LDEYDVKIVIDFQDYLYDKIVFSDVLQKNPKVFQNHIVMLFMVEQIEFFLDSQSLVYSLECHSLLKQCFQKGHSIELA